MEARELYRVLGLDADADGEDVKAAYRFLSKKYHPDRSGTSDSSARFVRVVKAYKVLDVELRKERFLNSPIRSRSRELQGSDDVFSLGSVLLGSDDPDLRRHAARRLGFSGKVAAYVFLRRALGDQDERVVSAAVRSIADLSIFQASGEIAALYARASKTVRSAILDAAETTGEPLFAQALDVAVREGGLEALRARRLIASDPSAGFRPGA